MSAAYPTFLAFEIPSAIMGNLSWIIGGLIILVGLVGVGLKDVIRFQPRRVWAISGVCFSESIRRRILWITPLAIVGVIIVAQLQKPSDEQDAIRQTTKFCLFATGLVVTISTIILACTSLPREIENRVIYTVVTKPTTRLEIVLGKIVGFARVSAAILIIMGFFTWGYLNVRAHSMTRDIKERLDTGAVDAVSRSTLEHYRDAGLLNAKSLAMSDNMGIYSRLPPSGEGRRYFSDGNVLVPFELPPDVGIMVDSEGKPVDAAGMVIRVRVGFDRSTMTPPPPPLAPGTTAPSTQPAAAPQILVQIFDPGQNFLLGREINGGKPIALNSPDGNVIEVSVPSASMSTLLRQPYFYVALLPSGGGGQFWIDSSPIELVVPVGTKPEFKTLSPTNPLDPRQPPHFIFAGQQGRDGQQIQGDSADKAPVGLFPFSGLKIDANSTEPMPFELRVSIENGGDAANGGETTTRVSLQARNRQTGKLVDVTEITPESNRTAYGMLPAAAVAGGDFDIIVRCLTPGHWIGLKPGSLAVVQAENSFGMNLVKSLLIIWLLTVLVISISIFCSTFLSWPIAIVLTLLILLGHWGVAQLGDAASAGLGRQFVQDFGVRDPAQAQALSTTVEQLNKFLTSISTILPDIDRFSATEDIERGITITSGTLLEALAATIGFGVPLSVLAYVFLKNKEVAP